MGGGKEIISMVTEGQFKLRRLSISMESAFTEGFETACRQSPKGWRRNWILLGLLKVGFKLVLSNIGKEEDKRDRKYF